MWLTDLAHIASSGFAAWLFVLRALPEWLQLAMTALCVSVWMLLTCLVCRRRPLWLRLPDSTTPCRIGSIPYERDPGVPQRSGSRVALNSFRHFGMPLLPFLVFCIPVAFIVALTEAHFGWRGAEPGEPLIIGATLAATPNAAEPISGRESNLRLPAELRLDAPALRIDGEGTILWRVRAEQAGEFPIRIRVGAAEADLAVVAGETFSALAPRRYRADDLRALAYPAVKPLAIDAGFQSATINYSRRNEDFLGLSHASWQLLGFAFMMTCLLRRLFASKF